MNRSHARLTRTLPAAMWALLVIASGCGSDEGGTSSVTTATSTERASRTPLGRRDVPPTGVRRQIDYFGVGDPPCPNVEAPGPVIALDSRPLYQFQRGAPRGPGEIEIGETLFICPRGFPFRQRITVRVNGPAGNPRTLTRLANTSGSEPVWALRIEPGLDRGRYRVVATEGGVRAATTLSIVAPRHRGVRIPAGGQVVPGAPIRLVGVGLPRSTRVGIDIYGGGGEHYKYVTTIHVKTDREGIGATSVPTSKTDPRGLYVFHPRLPGRHDQDMDATVFLGK